MNVFDLAAALLDKAHHGESYLYRLIVDNTSGARYVYKLSESKNEFMVWADIYPPAIGKVISIAEKIGIGVNRIPTDYTEMKNDDILAVAFNDICTLSIPKDLDYDAVMVLLRMLR